MQNSAAVVMEYGEQYVVSIGGEHILFYDGRDSANDWCASLNDAITPLLTSEYQRGYEDGRNSR